jgi:hypothetical protein
MPGKEGQDAVAFSDTIGDRASPVVAKSDFRLIEPNIVTAINQIILDSTDEHFVSVMAVTQKDAE